MNKQTTIKEPKTWAKVEPNFFKFDKIGDTLTGILTSKAEGTKMNFYTLKDMEGKDIKFHGSMNLDDLLQTLSIPCYVKITLIDELDVPNGTMKLFEVCKGEN